MQELRSASAKRFLSLISPVPASIAMLTALKVDAYGGLTFANFGTAGEDGITPAENVGALWGDIVLYLILTAYFDRGASSGTWGLSYFRDRGTKKMPARGYRSLTLLRISPCGSCYASGVALIPHFGLFIRSDSDNHDRGAFEDVDPSLEALCGLRVEGVTKYFGSNSARKAAITDVSFKL